MHKLGNKQHRKMLDKKAVKELLSSIKNSIETGEDITTQIYSLAYFTSNEDLLRILSKYDKTGINTEFEPKDIRYAVARNPAATKNILSKLANDKNKEVRLAAIGNPKVAQATVKKLTKDKDEEIRIAAEIRLQEPFTVSSYSSWNGE